MAHENDEKKEIEAAIAHPHLVALLNDGVGVPSLRWGLAVRAMMPYLSDQTGYQGSTERTWQPYRGSWCACCKDT